MNSSTVDFQLSTNLTSDDDSSPLDPIIGVLCFNILVSLPTQSCVLWLIVTGRGIALEFFNFNLTVCEIIYSLKSLVDILSLWFPSLTILNDYLEGLCVTGCPLFQCLICVERYLAVLHPVTFLKFRPLRYRVICAVVVWVATFGFNGVMTMFIASLQLDFFLGFILTQFLLFLSIQLFCCVSVLRALKQSGPGERGRAREEENNMKKRAFYIILITTVIILMMCVPYIVTGFLSVLIQQDISAAFITSLVCFSLSTFVHPVLYLNRVGKLFSLRPS